MSKIVTSYTNFAQGKADHDLQGRFDLQIYSTSLDLCKNFLTDFKGNALYRTGFENKLVFADCVLQEFKFSDNQNYICVFYENRIRFLSYDINNNFGWVLNGGSPYEVTTPYTLAQCRTLQFTGNRDVLTITSNAHLPRELTRIAANNFTLTIPSLKGDPFGLTFSSTGTITGITRANPAVITQATHGYSSGDRVVIEGVVGMTEINDYTATVTVINSNSYSVNINSTNFTAYASGGTAKRVLTTDYPACCLYYKGRRYFARTATRPTGLYGSESGIYDNYKIPTTITASSPISLSLTDISEQIEWLAAGDNSLVVGSRDGIVPVNSGDVTTPISAETVEGNVSSADAANSVIPTKKDGYVFYAGKTGRNLYYFNYDILSESFTAKDANITSYDVTDGEIVKLRYKKDKYNIIYCLKGNGKFATLAFYISGDEAIRGWHEHETEGEIKDIVVISDNNGTPRLFALVLRNSAYYIECLSDFIEFKPLYEFYTANEKSDFNAWYRYNAEKLKECNYLDNSSELSDLKSISITYNSGAGTITAASSVFVSGDVGKHIVYKTNTGYESGRFQITGFTSATVVSVSVLQEPTINTYSSWYLTFSTISGLSRFDGLSVYVVADGGFFNTYTVSGGTINLDKQVTHARIGYNYRGVLKSFPMGMVVSGRNTHMTVKGLNRIGLRCTTSMSGKFGASMYRLEVVQLLTRQDLNYLPPVPMDGTKYIDLVDDIKLDKVWYLVQDEPAPFTANCIMIDANYVS